MESHISFNGKSLDIIPSQGKVGPFRILSEKTKQKAKWKQKSKPTTMLLTNFRQMFLFDTPWKRQKPSCFFRCVLGVKKGNIGLKWVDNSGREILSIRNNATLIYGIMDKIQLRQVLAITLSTVSLSSFPRNSKVCTSDTLNQILQNLNLITRRK